MWLLPISLLLGGAVVFGLVRQRQRRLERQWLRQRQQAIRHEERRAERHLQQLTQQAMFDLLETARDASQQSVTPSEDDWHRP